jgi:hypothetical protein
MAELGKAVIAESPARIVESELARIEVFSSIPTPNGKSPAGAHTFPLAILGVRRRNNRRLSHCPTTLRL